MTFSKEDKSAWNNSEVMYELEKYAEKVLEGPPAEAFSPVEESGWEEENFEKALEEFESPAEKENIKEELQKAFSKLLINNLKKISNKFIDKSNIKIAYRIDQSIWEIESFSGGKNVK